MCTTCGCSGETKIHDHSHDHPHAGNHPAHQHDAMPHAHEHQQRVIEIERDLLSRNQHHADRNRQALKDSNTTCFNFVSSPGSGKTSLLVATIEGLKDRFDVAVIEGDQQTDNDAQRIKATGADAIQINTGKGCHLDAHAIGHAFEKLTLKTKEFVFIENVGNLVCPAAFDLGEQAKIVVLSVTEGEDKPLKYPDMFKASSLMILNKCDLLPYLDFDVEQCIEYARRINPKIEVIQLSATQGLGMDNWIHWLETRHSNTLKDQSDTDAQTAQRSDENLASQQSV